MDFDVTVDRQIYIGGSDIPAIMGISSFKTRYELLLEKAGLRESDFHGSRFTVYGQKLEPLIREYINAQMPTGAKFEPNKLTHGDIRCHTDGFNGYCVLEIKTTSRIYEKVEDYKSYLVQLLLYMQENGVESGLLAVYKRADDFNFDFSPANLSIYEVDIKDYIKLLEEINDEIERFRRDWKRLKENPLLSEQDFQPDALVLLSNKVEVLENRMAEFKELERQYKQVKEELYTAMLNHNVKSWQMPNGTRITRVDGSAGTTKTETVFDVEKFKVEHTGLYNEYQKTVTKTTSGRAGYVKITLP